MPESVLTVCGGSYVYLQGTRSVALVVAHACISMSAGVWRGRVSMTTGVMPRYPPSRLLGDWLARNTHPHGHRLAARVELG